MSKRAPRLLVTAALALALPAAVASARPTASATASADLYSVRVDDSGRRTLTRTPEIETLPSVSPDGRWLAFVRSRVVQGEYVQAVWVLHLGTGRSRQIAAAHADDYHGGPRWAPRGRRLAFSFFDVSTCTPGALKCATPEVRVADLGSDGFHTIRRHAVNPSWSPDGQWLVAEGDWIVGEPNALEVFDRAGRRVRTLSGVGTHPTWSPDGKLIAYVAERNSGDPNAAIAVERAGGGAARVVGRGSPPAWSPRGRVLVFEREGRIYRYELGRRARLLARGMLPSWSPSGARIAFFRSLRGRSELWVMGANGEAKRRVTSLGRRVYGSAAWSPDGRRLYYAAGRARR